MLALSLLVIAALTACAQAATTSTEVEGSSQKEAWYYMSVSVLELKLMLQNKDFLLINVHIPLASEIPGTDLAIPYNQVETHLSLLPKDREAEIVLYCTMGPMSDSAARTFVKQGFTSIMTLRGGMIAWERQGNELNQISR